MKELTHKRLIELLSYDPLTGFFTWKIKRQSNSKIGDIAGHVLKNGYRSMRIDNQRFYAHRLTWFYMFKEWPNNQIDHINMLKDDNRISNLREANNSQNRMNRGPQKNNKSGLKGVFYYFGKWRASINLEKKKIHLGTFNSKMEAYNAYCKAAVHNYKEFARTR